MRSIRAILFIPILALVSPALLLLAFIVLIMWTCSTTHRFCAIRSHGSNHIS